MFGNFDPESLNCHLIQLRQDLWTARKGDKKRAQRPPSAANRLLGLRFQVASHGIDLPKNFATRKRRLWAECGVTINDKKHFKFLSPVIYLLLIPNLVSFLLIFSSVAQDLFQWTTMSETEEHHPKRSPVIAGAERRDESKGDRAQSFLGLPLEFSSRHSTETFSDISTYSADHDSHVGRLHSVEPTRGYSRSTAPAKTWRTRSATFWARNKGLVLVVISQAFGALMSLSTRLLETEGSHGSSMHPFQVRFLMIKKVCSREKGS